MNLNKKIIYGIIILVIIILAFFIYYMSLNKSAKIEKKAEVVTENALFFKFKDDKTIQLITPESKLQEYNIETSEISSIKKLTLKNIINCLWSPNNTKIAILTNQYYIYDIVNNKYFKLNKNIDTLTWLNENEILYGYNKFEEKKFYLAKSRYSGKNYKIIKSYKNNLKEMSSSKNKYYFLLEDKDSLFSEGKLTEYDPNVEQIKNIENTIASYSINNNIASYLKLTTGENTTARLILNGVNKKTFLTEVEINYIPVSEEKILLTERNQDGSINFDVINEKNNSNTIFKFEDPAQTIPYNLITKNNILYFVSSNKLYKLNLE